MSSIPDFEAELLNLLPALRTFSTSLCKQTADADDLVQETITKALAHREKYQPYGSLKSWLFTIMKNTFCSKLKKSRRETAWEGCDSMWFPAAQEDAMELQDVGKTFNLLPDVYQLAIKYVVLDDLPYEAAAQAMDCSLGTVKSRLNRARRRLKRETD
ncbi:sigma-70 family RNA polymerase sigma factor [Brucella intermedia]|uniref:sigma-70 family RNA polymerase sigma factor n=1 Tax=Brucella intermedia TaxID=94625 RepID=UPI000469E073|nr:sigma-70 family RNA polymerase sigma factor [Brucella intermedia]